MITLKTNKGDIELTLDAEKAPNTIKGFMIQGGGFEAGLQQKKVGAPILNEANNGLKNNKYTVAMARTSDPHSATAQFFINATDNDFLNFTSESGSGWGYAVAIEAVATGNSQGYSDVPHEDVVIESVIIAQ